MLFIKNEFKIFFEDVKEKCEKLSEVNSELKDSFVKMKEDYMKNKIDYGNFFIVNVVLFYDMYEIINSVVKFDVVILCDDLSNVDQFSIYDEFIEKVEVMMLENQKLKKYLTDAIIKEKIVMESNDDNNELAVDNESFSDEIKKFKFEKEYFVISVEKFNKGEYF